MPRSGSASSAGARVAARLLPGQFVRIAKALADPRRFAVLETIAGDRGESCGCQRLRESFPVSKATISYHLKELVQAGVVEATREGQYVRCRVRRDVLEAYSAELLRRVGQRPARHVARD